jgi:hypothetical protein
MTKTNHRDTECTEREIFFPGRETAAREKYASAKIKSNRDQSAKV